MFSRNDSHWLEALDATLDLSLKRASLWLLILMNDILAAAPPRKSMRMPKGKVCLSLFLRHPEKWQKIKRKAKQACPICVTAMYATAGKGGEKVATGVADTQWQGASTAGSARSDDFHLKGFLSLCCGDTTLCTAQLIHKVLIKPPRMRSLNLNRNIIKSCWMFVAFRSANFQCSSHAINMQIEVLSPTLSSSCRW